MDIETVKAIYNKVFPNSMISGSAGHFCKELSLYTCYLAGNRAEFPHGISNNDALGYTFTIENGTYKEDSLYLTVNPIEKGLAFSSVKLRKKTINNLTPELLEKRFNEVKAFIREHKDNVPTMPFDINSKV